MNTKLLARDALKESNRQWKQLADSGDAGNWSAEEQAHYQASEKAIAALEAELARVVEPVARVMFNEGSPAVNTSNLLDCDLPSGTLLYRGSTVTANLVDSVNALLHQIDIGDFVDGHGHSAKMLKPVHDLMRFLSGDVYTAPPEPVNAWIAASKGLPEIDTPVLAMGMHAKPAIYPMMRVDGGDGWLWAAHQRGPIDDPYSYEVDDDYLVAEWMPLPNPPGATT